MNLWNVITRKTKNKTKHDAFIWEFKIDKTLFWYYISPLPFLCSLLMHSVCRRPKPVNSRQVGAINRSILLRTVVASTHIPAGVTQKSGLVLALNSPTRIIKLVEGVGVCLMSVIIKKIHSSQKCPKSRARKICRKEFLFYDFVQK